MEIPQSCTKPLILYCVLYVSSSDVRTACRNTNAWYKTAVSLLLLHWRYCNLAWAIDIISDVKTACGNINGRKILQRTRKSVKKTLLPNSNVVDVASCSKLQKRKQIMKRIAMRHLQKKFLGRNGLNVTFVTMFVALRRWNCRTCITSMMCRLITAMKITLFINAR